MTKTKKMKKIIFLQSLLILVKSFLFFSFQPLCCKSSALTAALPCLQRYHHSQLWFFYGGLYRSIYTLEKIPSTAQLANLNKSKKTVVFNGSRCFRLVNPSRKCRFFCSGNLPLPVPGAQTAQHLRNIRTPCLSGASLM